MSVGYAVGFEDMVDTVMRFTSKEKIEVRREAVPTYPRVAVREFAANHFLCKCLHKMQYVKSFIM